jgi:hypothetical protein
MAIEFFTEDFRADGYDAGLNSAFQGQLSSAYTNALSTTLQTEAADWIGFLAKTANGLSVQDALAVKAAVAAGNFSLSDLFGAAQSKDGSTANPTDPEPKLTVVIGEGDAAQTVVIDLRAILSDLDIETWTQSDTTGGGKKAVTTTTTHSREFYTDAGEPTDYDPDWSDEGGGGGDPELTLYHFVSDPIVIVKDNSSEPDDTFNLSLLLQGQDWDNVVLKVSGVGDYDANTGGGTESVTLSGDASLFLNVPDLTNVGGSPADSALNDYYNEREIAATDYADGSIDFQVAFTNNVNNGSSITVVYEYDYWA